MNTPTFSSPLFGLAKFHLANLRRYRGRYLRVYLVFWLIRSSRSRRTPKAWRVHPNVSGFNRTVEP